MDLHSRHKPSGLGKWLLALALVALFFLSLLSPRFWDLGSNSNSRPQSVLARLGTSTTSPPKLEPKPTSNAHDSHAPENVAIAVPQPIDDLPDGEIINAIARFPSDLPLGERLLPLPTQSQNVANRSEPLTKGATDIPEPRVFGAGAVTEQNNSTTEAHFPQLTFPAVDKPSESNGIEESSVDVTNDSPIVDPIPSRTEPRISPTTISNEPKASAPLSREEIVRSRWPWLRPRRMDSYLAALADHAECAMWAEEVRWLIEGTFSPGDLADNLPLLREQVEYADEIITGLGNSEYASLMRRAAYALKRNLVTWELTADSMRISTGGAANDRLTPSRLRELAECLTRVEGRLATTADRQAWRNYLRLAELVQITQQAEASSQLVDTDPALAVLDDVSLRMSSPQLTAGQAKFLRAGALGDLQLVLAQLTAQPVDRSHLLTALEQFEFSGLPHDAERVAIELQALRTSGHPIDTQLANTLDGYYRNNNVRVVVSDQFLTRMLPAQEDRNEYVSDTILGVPIRGHSNTKTRLAMKMSPGDSAALDLMIMGDVDSLTQGESGPVRTFNHTDATYVVHKKLVLDGRGIRALPGRIDVYANSQLQCLETDFDGIPLFGSIVRGVAEQQVEETRDEARREIEQRIAAKVLSRVDSEADEGFAKMNARMFERLAIVQNLGLQPAAWFQHPDDHRLAVHLRMAADQQLAAHTPRPRAMSNSVASLQIHQSTLNNLLEGLEFNGATVTVQEAFLHVIDKLSLGMSFASIPDTDAEITFVEENPITVNLEDGIVRVSLRLRKITSPEGSWGPMGIYVNYRPVPTGSGYALYREGPISLDTRALRFRDRVIIRGVFSNVFKKDEPVSIFENALSSDPRFAGLGVTQFAVEDGWLGISIAPALDRIVESPDGESRELNLRR